MRGLLLDETFGLLRAEATRQRPDVTDVSCQRLTISFRAPFSYVDLLQPNFSSEFEISLDSYRINADHLCRTL